MTKITRHSASAALEMLPDGVLIVRLGGPITVDSLLHFKAAIVSLHGSEIRAYVADYTRATIALTGAELDAVLEGEPGDAPPSMPAAMVVHPDNLELFIGHASRMALRGVFRRVEVSMQAAEAWARAQLPVRQPALHR